MSLISDITDLTEKVVADFESGSYASLAKDVSDGFGKLSDFLHTFVGFQAKPGDFSAEDDAKVQKAVADGMACCTKHKAKCFAAAGATAGFDPSVWLTRFQLLLNTLAALWATLKPTPVPAA